MKRAEKRPLAVNLLWRTSVYYLISLAFEFLDPGLRSVRTHHPRFWMIQVWLIVLLLLFAGVRGFARRLGAQEFKRLLFERPTEASVTSEDRAAS